MANQIFDNRADVWVALSELFIDTQLTGIDKARIVDKLKKTGYTLSETEQILEDEVFPAFSNNLLAVTGNWSGWPEDEVKQKVTKQLNSSASNSFKWWRRLRIKLLLGNDWLDIKKDFLKV